MVSIGKADWYHKTSGINPQQQAVGGVRFGSNSGSGGGTLIDRLDAIDRGQPVSGNSSYGNVSGESSLQARLDAIGNRELRPNTEREFDIIA